MTTVLLVDDNQADLEILRLAFEDIPSITVVPQHSGHSALKWLLTTHLTSDVLMVTDLNMPVMDGIRLIQEVRQACDVPPISLVVSTSDRPVDIGRAYAGGANGYHTKPMGFHETKSLCRQIVDYWCTSVARPQIIPAPRS